MRFTANCGSISVFRSNAFPGCYALYIQTYSELPAVAVLGDYRLDSQLFAISGVFQVGQNIQNRAEASIGQLAHRHNEYAGGGDSVRGY